MERSEVIYIENDFIKADTKLRGGEWCSLVKKRYLISNDKTWLPPG